jgi:hypothetical protein
VGVFVCGSVVERLRMVEEVEVNGTKNKHNPRKGEGESVLNTKGENKPARLILMEMG